MKSPLISISQSPLSTSITNSPPAAYQNGTSPETSTPNFTTKPPRNRLPAQNSQQTSPGPIHRPPKHNRTKQPRNHNTGAVRTHIHTRTQNSNNSSSSLLPPPSSSSTLEPHADADNNDDDDSSSIRNGRKPKLHPNYSTTSLTLPAFQQQQQHRLPLADVQAMEAASEGSFGNPAT
jgi:hypothetical protein